MIVLLEYINYLHNGWQLFAKSNWAADACKLACLCGRLRQAVVSFKYEH